MPELTESEIREQFLDHVWYMIGWWQRNSKAPEIREKLEGLAFSILVALDGDTSLPRFMVAPMPHPDDKAFHQEQDDDWFPDNNEAAKSIKGDISGCLHELLWRGHRGKAMEEKPYRVIRMKNGVKEYLTMDLDAMTMKASFYYAPPACAYPFTKTVAEELAAKFNGQIELKE